MTLSALLERVCQETGAEKGYVELRDSPDDPNPAWTASWRADDSELGALVSRGIMSMAVASGQAVQVPLAVEDARLASNQSVQQSRIQAVICAPVGSPPVGALYVERSQEFGAMDLQAAGRCAHDLGTLHRQLSAAADPTRAVRQRLGGASAFIGRSPAAAELLDELHQATFVDRPLLLVGPPGCGKNHAAQVFADALDKRLVSVNTAGLSPGVFIAELFGAKRGSHSTATRDRDGIVAQAQDAVLLLDEVGAIDDAAQAALLEFVDTGTYRPVGSDRPRKSSVRLVMGTNEPERLRADLRGRAWIVRMPTLQQRAEDVPLLARRLAEAFIAGNSRMQGMEVAPSLPAALAGRSWPGEVRELLQAVERATVRAAARGDRYVAAHHVSGGAPEPMPQTYHGATQAFQKQLVLQALTRHNWVVTEAARELDLARSRLYELIKKFELSRVS